MDKCCSISALCFYFLGDFNIIYFWSFIYYILGWKGSWENGTENLSPLPHHKAMLYLRQLRSNLGFVIVSWSCGKGREIKAERRASRLSSWLTWHPHLHGRLIRIKNRSNELIGLGTCTLPARAIVKEQIQLPLKAVMLLIEGEEVGRGPEEELWQLCS